MRVALAVEPGHLRGEAVGRIVAGARPNGKVAVMFKRILLPLDLSDRHRSTVDLAAGLAKQSGGEVVLLHVIEIIPGLRLDEERAFYGRLEKMAQKHLDSVSRRLSERKVTCQCKVTYGQRAREVTDQADALAADLIVLTAPRIDAGNPSGWGSLSWKIGVLCKCPLLLVKQDAAVVDGARLRNEGAEGDGCFGRLPLSDQGVRRIQHQAAAPSRGRRRGRPSARRARLATRLELAPGRLARVADRFRGAHTAGPIVALEAAIESGRFAAAKTVLFATVGAGIAVGLALYRT